MPQRTAAHFGDERMIVTLESYLARLREDEAARPEAQRRHVPEIAELAKDIGVSYSTLRRLANNEMSYLRFDMGGAIIRALRARGFDTDVSDVLRYVEE